MLKEAYLKERDLVSGPESKKFEDWVKRQGRRWCSEGFRAGRESTHLPAEGSGEGSLQRRIFSLISYRV